MPTDIQVQGVGLLRFPDGMSQADIKQVLDTDPMINRAGNQLRMRQSAGELGIPVKPGTTDRGKQGLVTDPDAAINAAISREQKNAADYSLLGSHTLGALLGRPLSAIKNAAGAALLNDPETAGLFGNTTDYGASAYTQDLRKKVKDLPFSSKMAYYAGAGPMAFDPVQTTAENEAARAGGLPTQAVRGVQNFGSDFVSDPTNALLLGATGFVGGARTALVRSARAAQAAGDIERATQLYNIAKGVATAEKAGSAGFAAQQGYGAYKTFTDPNLSPGEKGAQGILQAVFAALSAGHAMNGPEIGAPPVPRADFVSDPLGLSGRPPAGIGGSTAPTGAPGPTAPTAPDFVDVPFTEGYRGMGQGAAAPAQVGQLARRGLLTPPPDQGGFTAATDGSLQRGRSGPMVPTVNPTLGPINLPPDVSQYRMSTPDYTGPKPGRGTGERPYVPGLKTVLTVGAKPEAATDVQLDSALKLLDETPPENLNRPEIMAAATSIMDEAQRRQANAGNAEALPSQQTANGILPVDDRSSGRQVDSLVRTEQPAGQANAAAKTYIRDQRIARAGISVGAVAKLVDSSMSPGQIRQFIAEESEKPVEMPKLGRGRPSKTVALPVNPAPVTAEPAKTAPLTTAPPTGIVEPRGVADVPVSDIMRDPTRFQYKTSVGAKGISGELSGVKWNKNLQGVVSLWIDPETGKKYVVNGHNRHVRAEEAGVKSLPAVYIDAPDAAGARFVGALQNIAEGRGTAIDAAKIFREQGLTPELLTEEGVSLKGKTAADGLALSKLPEALWNATFKHEMPIDRAVAIGGAGLGQSQQLALNTMLQKKKVTDPGVIRELVKFVQGAGESEVSSESLFGEESLQQSNALEKAKLADWLKKELARDKRTFKPLADEGRAKAASSAGNLINVSENRRLVENAEQVGEMFDRFAYRSGPIADALNKAAGELARGGNETDVKRRLRAEATNAFKKLTGAKAEDAKALDGAQAGDKGDRQSSDNASQDSTQGLLYSGFNPELIKQVPEALKTTARLLFDAGKSLADFVRKAGPEYGKRYGRLFRQIWNYVKSTIKPGSSERLELPQGVVADHLRNTFVQNLSTLHRVARGSWTAVVRYGTSHNQARNEVRLRVPKVLKVLSEGNRERFQTYLVADRMFSLVEKMKDQLADPSLSADTKREIRAQGRRMWVPIDPVDGNRITAERLEKYFKQKDVQNAVEAHKKHVEPLLEQNVRDVGFDPSGIRGKHSGAFTPAIALGLDGEPLAGQSAPGGWTQAKPKTPRAPGAEAFSGTADFYEPDYQLAIENRVFAGTRAANAVLMWRRLLKDGIAVPADRYNGKGINFDGRERPGVRMRIEDRTGKKITDLPETVVVPDEVAREMNALFEHDLQSQVTEGIQAVFGRTIVGNLAGMAEGVAHGAALSGRTGLIIRDWKSALANLTPQTRTIRAIWEIFRTEFDEAEMAESSRVAARYGALKSDFPVERPASLSEAVRDPSKVMGNLLYGENGLHTRALALIYRYGKKEGWSNHQIGEAMLELNAHAKFLEPAAQKGVQRLGLGTFYQTGVMNRVVGFRYGVGVAMLAGSLLLYSAVQRASDTEGKWWFNRPGQKIGEFMVGKDKDGRPLYWNIWDFLNRPAAYSQYGVKSVADSATRGNDLRQTVVKLGADTLNQGTAVVNTGPVGGALTYFSPYLPYFVPNDRLTGVKLLDNPVMKADWFSWDRMKMAAGATFPLTSSLFGEADEGYRSNTVKSEGVRDFNRFLRVGGLPKVRAGELPGKAVANAIQNRVRAANMRRQAAQKANRE